MFSTLSLEVRKVIKPVANRRFLLAIGLYFISTCSMAQELFPGRQEDKKFFESGGRNGEKCLHVSSYVPGERKVAERNASLEAEAIVTAGGPEHEFNQALEYTLEQYGFVKVEESIYELPNSSLCFLKVYRAESQRPTGLYKVARFTPYYRAWSERDNWDYSDYYDSREFVELLNKVFVISGLAEHANAYTELLLIHYPIRSLPPPTPLDNH